MSSRRQSSKNVHYGQMAKGMHSFHVLLVLEGLCALYSVDELDGRSRVKCLLVDHLRLSDEDAEALIEGAIRLKLLREDETPGNVLKTIRYIN